MIRKRLPEPHLTTQDRTRFWTHVRKGSTDECWPWIASRDNHDYGKFRFGGRWQNGGRDYKSHRIAHLITTGEWPEVVMHTCDNPPCCNPTHLRSGTPLENSKDSVAKGRARGGHAPMYSTSNPNVKLSPQDIETIRQIYASTPKSQSTLARIFNVAQSTIGRIVRGLSRTQDPGSTIVNPPQQGRRTGSANPAAKLNTDQIAEIRALYATGKYTQANLAERYHVSQVRISQLVRHH